MLNKLLNTPLVLITDFEQAFVSWKDQYKSGKISITVNGSKLFGHYYTK